MRIDDELQDVANFWSQRYSSEGFIWGKNPSTCARDALSRFRSYGVEDVLILGCGYGRDAKYIAGQGLNVTAVDFAQEGLKLASSWTIEDSSTVVNFVLDNIVDLALPDSRFDAVFSHRTLHLLISVDRLERGLGQIHRVLKPGGHACISVRSPRDPSKTRSTPLSGAAAELSFRPGHKVLYLSEAEFTEIVGRQFTVLEFQEMSERESNSQQYDVKLHYVVLEKNRTRRG